MYNPVPCNSSTCFDRSGNLGLLLFCTLIHAIKGDVSTKKRERGIGREREGEGGREREEGRGREGERESEEGRGRKGEGGREREEGRGRRQCCIDM